MLKFSHSSGSLNPWSFSHMETRGEILRPPGGSVLQTIQQYSVYEEAGDILCTKHRENSYVPY
jgi:hypothetical protein